MNKHPFNRSGLAALSDLQTPEWRQLFEPLEKEQAAFLEKDAQFRSQEYKWPRDPLHEWSRRWEYPYVFYHLKSLRTTFNVKFVPHLADIGSGVTFFPFSVARLGYRVTCCDIDPVCETDLTRAIRLTSAGSGCVGFRRTDGMYLPFGDAELDAVYCISVLEHVANCAGLVHEIARILKPNGLFLLTFDLDTGLQIGLDVKEHRQLQESLVKHFDYLFPQTTIHPDDVLKCSRWPYGATHPPEIELLLSFVKQWLVKPLLGRPPIRLKEQFLASQGVVMINK